MNIDESAERIIQKIKSYMDADENKTLTKEEEEEALISILKILIKEIATITLTATIIELTKAINDTVEKVLKEKKDGHL